MVTGQEPIDTTCLVIHIVDRATVSRLYLDSGVSKLLGHTAIYEGFTPKSSRTVICSLKEGTNRFNLGQITAFSWEDVGTFPILGKVILRLAEARHRLPPITG